MKDNSPTKPDKALLKESLMRMLGWLLMVGTIGLISCQAMSQFMG